MDHVVQVNQLHHAKDLALLATQLHMQMIDGMHHKYMQFHQQ
jgi:hypothetical protein